MIRKCPACKKWNEDNAYCKYCNEPISPQIIRDLEDEEDLKKNQPLKKSPLDKLQENIENSNNPFVIAFNKVLRLVWIVYMGILSFVIWFVTAIAG